VLTVAIKGRQRVGTPSKDVGALAGASGAGRRVSRRAGRRPVGRRRAGRRTGRRAGGRALQAGAARRWQGALGGGAGRSTQA
jgi:hypothetical protein